MKTSHLVSFVTSLLAAGAALGCTSEEAVAPLPETCQDVADADPALRDDEYTLYFEGDLDQPWLAYCKDMRRSPIEYLTLVRTGGSYNFSELSVRRTAGTERLRTHFTKLRIDPETLEIDVNDREYADSGIASQVVGTGATEMTVTKMPYATAGACQQHGTAVAGDEPQDAPANLDLTGTPFTVDNDFCHAGANPKMVEPAQSSDDSAIDLLAGSTTLTAGSCAWTAPSTPSCPGLAPFASGNAVLQLDYIRVR